MQKGASPAILVPAAQRPEHRSRSNAATATCRHPSDELRYSVPEPPRGHLPYRQVAAANPEQNATAYPGRRRSFTVPTKTQRRPRETQPRANCNRIPRGRASAPRNRPDASEGGRPAKPTGRRPNQTHNPGVAEHQPAHQRRRRTKQPHRETPRRSRATQPRANCNRIPRGRASAPRHHPGTGIAEARPHPRGVIP